MQCIKKCVSINNQECKVRPKIININSDEPSFYPYSILVIKCSGSCNNINDPHAKLCIYDVIKNMNIKVFNLMSRNNETCHRKWHKLVNVMEVFVMINNTGIMINAEVNVKIDWQRKMR